MKNFKYIIRKNIWLVSVYMLTGISAAFLLNFNANYFQILTDRFSDGTLNFAAIAVYCLTLTLMCAVNYFDNYPDKRLSNGVYLDFKLLALRKISTVDYLSYVNIGTGELIQRVENGAAAGKSILVDFMLRLFRELLPSMIFSMIFIMNINKNIMFAMLAGYILVFIVTNLLLKALYKIKEKILTDEESFSGVFVRGLSEMVTFRINRQFKREIQRAEEASGEIVSSKVKMTLIHEAFFAVFALIVISIKIALILYAWTTRGLSVGEVIALLALIDNAYTPIAIFNVLYVQFKLDKAAFKRFSDFLLLDEDRRLSSGKAAPSTIDSVEFKNISFSYGDKSVIKDMNYHINSGEKTAIIGESGSGKSTILKLLTGLIKPDKGEIFISKQPLSEMNLTDYYEHIIYISQDAPIFEGTLRENIIFDKTIGDAQILSALDEVCLAEFYKKSEHGLDTRIGERGANISGGERQRLALARLWFSDADLVILDEATSNVDTRTEQLIQDSFEKLTQGRTSFVIAHRLSTVRNANAIMVLEHGEIIERGDHEELLAQKGRYYNLYTGKAELD